MNFVKFVLSIRTNISWSLVRVRPSWFSICPYLWLLICPFSTFIRGWIISFFDSTCFNIWSNLTWLVSTFDLVWLISTFCLGLPFSIFCPSQLLSTFGMDQLILTFCWENPSWSSTRGGFVSTFDSYWPLPQLGPC